MIIDLISAHASPLAALVGGQNVHVAALASALARRGHEVTILTRRDAVASPDVVAYAPGVTVEHVRAGPARPMDTDRLSPYRAEFATELARRWAMRPADVVHAHCAISGLAALEGARDHGIPVVQTFHVLAGRAGTDAATRERRRRAAQVGRDATAVIATCAEQVAELGTCGVAPDAVHVVPCGVDTERFTPDGPAAERGTRPRIITIGRLCPRGGIDTVIEALCHVPDAELVVAGGAACDDDPGEPQRLAQARGVAPRVTFAGPVPHVDLPALIRSADAVVSVPWYEPSGRTALEAMACGAPVVVSAVGGHLDVVVDGVTGLYVPPRVPSALAGRLRRLLTDPRLGPSLGRTAAERIRERYTWPRIAAETEAVYRHVREPRLATAREAQR